MRDAINFTLLSPPFLHPAQADSMLTSKKVSMKCAWNGMTAFGCNFKYAYWSGCELLVWQEPNA